MKDYERLAMICVATDEKQMNVTFSVGETVEDLCIKICKRLKIGPVTRHLFALRNYSSKLWLPCGHKLEGKGKGKYEFRLRFKPSNLQRLRQIDIHAYNYYFHQVRTDVVNSKVPDIVYEKHKHELIGLGVSDMYRVMLERDLSQEIVESQYRDYIPKECVKKHSFFIKKPIHIALTQISGHDIFYVKEQYLKQFESMAPNYPYEEYKALMDKGVPNLPAKVLLRVNIEEVKYFETDTESWRTLCAIEDLCFISIRQDNTVEVSRKNGIPSYLKFSTNAMLMSFVSAMDGYYRLSIKWTFNLCRDVITPTLERLHKLKCHGPVGEEFSYAKLKEKRANRPGSYIVRESEIEYDVYYIDVCSKDGKLLSQRVEQVESNKFLMPGRTESYESLGNLISSFQNPENSLYLEECLPPSEYDMSPLLICASENVVSEVAADEEIISALLEGGPRCVPRDQLQVYKTLVRNDEDLTRATSATKLHRAMWRVAKGKKLEIAMKILKTEENSYTKEFLELAGKWGQLRSGALVRLYGITVSPAIGMLFELVKLGPLDMYLRNNSRQTVKTVDMVEATACLATALWHLEENHVVHGNIRCERVLVHAHTDNSFIVKLGDPGLFIYTEADIHWIPPECYNNLESAKYSLQADIWALATTIWEIFSRGTPLPVYSNTSIVKKFYELGQRLPTPSRCPNEVYKLMLECWGDNNASRKQPQAIMRDINQILYQVYNSRRTHAYATAFPKLFTDDEVNNDDDDTDTEESKSTSESHASSLFTSVCSDRTSLTWDDVDDEATRRLVDPHENYVDSTEELSTYMGWLTDTMNDSNTRTPGGSNRSLHPTRGDSLGDTVRFKNGNANENGGKPSSVGGSSDSSFLCQMPEMLELDTGEEVILQGRIGQGFYGEVYRGTLTRHNVTIRQVAIKRLKVREKTNIEDFDREIGIMKDLKHQNIVEILNVTSYPERTLIMEFITHGSLQSYLITHRETLTHSKLLSFALDIATGMEYVGHKNIVHRDLAARNILVASEDRVKISDFGLAQTTGNSDYYIFQTNRDLPLKWYAPESIRDGKFSSRSDVWSFGVTMYETFSFGEDPKLPEIGLKYRNGTEQGFGTELLTALERGARLPCPPKCPQEVYVKLMRPCWNLQSHERPGFAALCLNIRKLLMEY